MSTTKEKWAIAVGACLMLAITTSFLALVLFLRSHSAEDVNRERVEHDLLIYRRAMHWCSPLHGNKQAESMEEMRNWAGEFTLSGYPMSSIEKDQVLMFQDPWKRDYLFAPPSSSHRMPRIYTLGRDGLPGGDGEDADVSTDDLENIGD